MELDKNITKIFLLFLSMTLIFYFLSLRPPMGSRMISVYSSYISVVLGAGTGIVFLFFFTQLLLPGSGAMMSEAEIDSRYSTSDPNVRSKKKENFLSSLNLFGGKKRCNECGTELEYREVYQSYYCSECRTYKRQQE